MIDARLHPSDVVAHDEEDVWLLSRSLSLSLGLCRPKPGTQRTSRKQHGAAEQAEFVHICLTSHISTPLTNIQRRLRFLIFPCARNST